MSECNLCKKAEIEGHGHNGQPLVDGLVCDSCNPFVIKYRMMDSKVICRHKYLEKKNNGK